MTRYQIVWREFTKLSANSGRIPALLQLPYLVLRNYLFAEDTNQVLLDPGGVAFDRHYGVDTRGISRLAHLPVFSQNWVHGLDYQPVQPNEFDALLRTVEVAHGATTFVDLGAGKGRALMLASKLPFRRLIGVEFVPELVVRARENVAAFLKQSPDPPSIDILCEDAATYQFPLDPLVIFLYNPFTAPVMAKVIENLLASLCRAPRRVVVVYLRPELADMWGHARFIKLRVATARYQVYDTASA